MGESVINCVKSLGSTRLKAPGDMEVNMVSKISKPLSSVLDIEASRHVLNRGSFMSKMFPVEWGVNADNGAVDVVEGTVVVKPLDRLRGD